METETRPPSPPPQPTTSMADAVAGLWRLLNGHGTLAAARDISPEALDSMYGIAREQYVNGRHAEALAAFGLLCLYDHLDARHWRGLAACRQAARDYAGAAGALAFAVGQTAGPTAELELQLAQCLIADGASDAAEQVLGRLDETVVGAAADGPFGDKVRVLREQLRKLPLGGASGPGRAPSTA